MLLKCLRWKKPKRENLTTQEYFSDYKREQSRSDSEIKVYRGLGDEFFPEPKGSTKGSLKDAILEKLSLGQGSKDGDRPAAPDQSHLLSEISHPGDSSDDLEMDNVVVHRL